MKWPPLAGPSFFLSFLIFFVTPREVTAQTPVAPFPRIAITVTPQVVQAVNGKLPSSLNLAVFASREDCDKPSFSLASGYTLLVTGSGLSLPISSQSAGACSIAGTLSIDSNSAAGSYSVLLLYNPPTATPTDPNPPKPIPVGSATFAILDAAAAAIPPGLPPQVDVMWQVMSQDNCKDVFGKRVAQSVYCIQIKIGNNSGHPLQIAGIGFCKRLEKLPGTPDITFVNNSYASTRAVLLGTSFFDARNLAYDSVQAAGILMTSFTPFFVRPNAKFHFATAAGIVSGPLLQAFNIILPNPIIGQLNNLDDQSFRDNAVIPNNSHMQTVIFIEKEALAEVIADYQLELADWAKPFDPKSKSGASGKAIQADQENAQTSQTKAAVAQAVAQSVRTITNGANSTVKNAKRSSLFNGKFSPLFVKLALGNLIIVGDQIAYLQRVQIQSGTSPASTTPPLSASPSSLSFKDQNLTTVSDPLPITIANTSASPVTNVSAKITGSSEFQISSNSCTSTLASAANCKLSVTFKPASAANPPTGGDRTANLEIGTSPGSPLSISLKGNAAVPKSLTFSEPNLSVGQTAAATLTITNFDSNPVTALALGTVTAPAGVTLVEFHVASNTCPTSLTAKANCRIDFTFTPATSGGNHSATVDIAYQPTGGTLQHQTITLTGLVQ